MKFLKPKSGTTLVEITLYFAMVGIFLTAAMSFAIQIFHTSSLSSNMHELQSNLDFATQKMVYTIQTADSVDADGSTFDSTNGVLSLNMSESAESPTVFSLSGGNMFMQEGAAAAVQLNSVSVKVDSLQFHRITYDKSPDQIVIDAVMNPLNDDISNLQQTFNLHLSVSLRSL